MAHTFSDIIFFNKGGLNWDDDIITLDVGDARFRQNVTISDDSNFNVFTNMLGNTRQATAVGGGAFTYPTGDLKVIGFEENKEDKSGIFFVYSDTNNHAIIEYFSETNELDYVGIVTSSLNFPATGYIDSCIIGNEDDKWLVWVGGDNEPKMFPLRETYTMIGEETKVYRSPVLTYIRQTYQES